MAKRTLNKDGKERKRPVKMTRPKFLKALKGTHGIKTVIAERLDCSWLAVHNFLKKWIGSEIEDAYNEECERVGDIAENRIIQCIQLGLDENIATQNARWLLSRKCKDRGYGDKQTITHEGGENPIELKSEVMLDFESMPLELKKELLKYVKKTNKKGK